MLQNDAQRLKLHRRGILLFFNVICQISRSYGTKKSPILTRIERLLFFKVIRQISRSRSYKTKLGVSGLLLQFIFTDSFEKMHKAWCGIEEVPYCLSRSSIDFQGSIKSPTLTRTECFRTVTSVWIHRPISLKWCPKLNVVYKRCSIVFQVHPSNFKVTQDKKSPIFTRIKRFRTITPVWIYLWILNDVQSLM